MAKRTDLIKKYMSELGKLSYKKKPQTKEEYQRRAKIRWDKYRLDKQKNASRIKLSTKKNLQ